MTPARVLPGDSGSPPCAPVCARTDPTAAHTSARLAQAWNSTGRLSCFRRRVDFRSNGFISILTYLRWNVARFIGPLALTVAILVWILTFAAPFRTLRIVAWSLRLKPHVPPVGPVHVHQSVPCIRFPSAPARVGFSPSAGSPCARRPANPGGARRPPPPRRRGARPRPRTRARACRP